MSDQSLLEEGSASSAGLSQISEHTYTSLMSAPRRIVAYNEQSVSSYLHPQASQLGSSSSSSRYLHPQPSHGSTSSLFSRRNRHHGRRKASSSSQSSVRRTEEVVHRFKKLQICVAVLCAANVLTVAIFLLTHPKLSPFFAYDDDDFFTTGDGDPKSFKLCTKCQPLEAKAGFGNGLIEDIRSSKFPEFCCFRRVDQLLKLFDGYAENYVDQEVFKVRQEMSNKIISAKPGRNVSLSFPLAHVFYKETTMNTEVLSWTVKGDEILLEGELEMQQGEFLKVPRTGFYYIYSHLELKPGSQTSHKLLKNYSRDNKRILLSRDNNGEKNSLVSELQGIFRLDRGDTVSILATKEAIQADRRRNYFGLFILEK